MKLEDVYQEYWQSLDEIDTDDRVAIEEFIEYVESQYDVEIKEA